MKKLNLVGLGILGSIIIFFVIAVPSGWIQSPEQVAAHEHGLDQSTATLKLALPDSALYAKLPDDSYKQIAYRVMSGGTVMDGRDFFTCWISYTDQHGFSHSLNVLRGAHLQSLKYEEPRRITVHVSTPDSTVRDFSYMLLPGDFVLFNSLADTAQIDMIRLAMHEFINLDR